MRNQIKNIEVIITIIVLVRSFNDGVLNHNIISTIQDPQQNIHINSFDVPEIGEP